jgi:vitamin B12 transporter
LKAESSKNYEGGLSFVHKHIDARAVYFYREINNGIDYNYIDYNYFNYIKQKVMGVELEVTARPCELLTISANYTYMSSKEVTQNRKTNQDTISYSYLLRRPTHNLNVTIGVQPLKSLYFSVSGKYVSKRYDVGGYMQPDISLGDYFIMGAYGEFRYNKQLKFFANLQNITDRQFFDVSGYNSIPFLMNAGISINL